MYLEAWELEDRYGWKVTDSGSLLIQGEATDLDDAKYYAAQVAGAQMKPLIWRDIAPESESTPKEDA